MRRIAVLAGVLLALAASPALACSGLIGPRGSVDLGRTTTLAAYHRGIEHYVTAFSYSGGGGKFGSIVPLPGIPTTVERGGDWTLQRLVREVRPPVAFARASSAQSARLEDAEVISQTRVDALDLTVLRGGALAVGKWAKDHGFVLPPDAPEVLDFYAKRSQIFMTAVFDADEAAQRGQQIGDGTPIHLSIPTANPWVPLRILSLGKTFADLVEADVFLLTDRKPALLPAKAPGLSIGRREPASESLLSDLRSDKGMEWVPRSMWLTHVDIASQAGTMRYDLAVDVSGRSPSRVAAGLRAPVTITPAPTPPPTADATQPLPATPSPGIAIDDTPASSSGRPVAFAIVVLLLAVVPLAWTVVRRR